MSVPISVGGEDLTCAFKQKVASATFKTRRVSGAEYCDPQSLGTSRDLKFRVTSPTVSI